MENTKLLRTSFSSGSLTYSYNTQGFYHSFLKASLQEKIADTVLPFMSMHSRHFMSAQIGKFMLAIKEILGVTSFFCNVNVLGLRPAKLSRKPSQG